MVSRKLYSIGNGEWFFGFPLALLTRQIDAFIETTGLFRSSKPELISRACGRPTVSVPCAPEGGTRQSLTQWNTKCPSRNVGIACVFNAISKSRNQSATFCTLVFCRDERPRSTPTPPIRGRDFSVGHPTAVHVVFPGLGIRRAHESKTDTH